jgi:hypothetical protein
LPSLLSARSQGGWCGLKNTIVGVPVPVVSERTRHVCGCTKKREGKSKGSTSPFPHLQWTTGASRNRPVLARHIVTASAGPRSLRVHHRRLVAKFPRWTCQCPDEDRLEGVWRWRSSWLAQQIGHGEGGEAVVELELAGADRSGRREMTGSARVSEVDSPGENALERTIHDNRMFGACIDDWIRAFNMALPCMKGRIRTAAYLWRPTGE